jgi:hypothetical protein
VEGLDTYSPGEVKEYNCSDYYMAGDALSSEALEYNCSDYYMAGDALSR